MRISTVGKGTTDELESRMEELYKKILRKRKLINRYKGLVYEMEDNCTIFTKEYEAIDRVLFIREERVTILSNAYTKRENEKKKIVEKRIEKMSESEVSILLNQLTAIRDSRD